MTDLATILREVKILQLKSVILWNFKYHDSMDPFIKKLTG
jgi:hypothetical protein